ncbi:hypothetical protein SAMN05421690_10784 [Nitrosomonas sp. Nm51]|nr:hypothetical protein SAMN05421690_10784 [Nitrosomonas sp. Nm51]
MIGRLHDGCNRHLDIYADRLKKMPQRCYAAGSRSHFAFSDARKLITRTALDKF